MKVIFNYQYSNTLKLDEHIDKVGLTFLDENSMMTHSLQSFQVRGFRRIDKLGNENNGFSKYQNQKGKKDVEELKLSRSKQFLNLILKILSQI